MSIPMPLPVFDRRPSKLFDEFMDDSTSTYEARPHRSVIQWITSSPTVDWLIAAYQNTRFTARKIHPFIRKHKVDMSEFEPGPFDSYAGFSRDVFCPVSAHFRIGQMKWGRSPKRVTSAGKSSPRSSAFQ